MTLPNANESQRHAAALETVFQNLGDGVLVLDHELRIVLANHWIERRYSGTEPLVGQKCYTALYKRESVCPACPSLRALQTGKPQTQSAKISTGSDRSVWLESFAYPLPAGPGETGGVIELIKDVTKLRQTEDRLRDETALHHIFIDESRDGIVVLDPNGAVHEANHQFTGMLGLSMDELRQSRVWDWDPQWQKERLLGLLDRAEMVNDSFEMRFQRKNRPPIYVEIASTGATIAGRKLIYWSCRDITDRKALQEQLRTIGIHDPLTGLYNRRYVLERLAETSAEYLRGGSEYCVSILDLDRFKTVNDVHGPKHADLALEEFAHTVAGTVRPYDLVGRFGGDEFIIVSKNAGQTGTEAMIRRILGTIRGKDLSFEGHRIRLTFSCGLAYCGELPADSFSVEAMIARAYAYLDNAKIAGGDRCVSGLSPEAAIPAGQTA